MQVHNSVNQARVSDNHKEHPVTETSAWSVKTWQEPQVCGQTAVLYRSVNVCIFPTIVAYPCKIKPDVKLPVKLHRSQAFICH